jgi:phosphoenolpyruvate---glycerone phosphotransferase subunit DhaL
MSSASRISYDDVVAWVRLLAERLHAEKEYLTELDSAIGDADHGINMDRGFQAVTGKLDTLASPDIGGCLKTIGSTLVSTVGGASGPLYGMLFIQMGGAAAGKETLSVAEFAVAFDAGIGGVLRIGKAGPGDKTMLEALLPAKDALDAAAADGSTVGAALERAAEAAEAGMRATIPLVARKGRASYLGERSAGHQDPGATSSALLLRSAANAWSGI